MLDPDGDGTAASELAKSYTIGHDVFLEAVAANETRRLLKDGHGSTRMLVDALGNVIANGSTPQIYAYDAYGVPHGFAPALALTTHLYSGEMTDQLTGLQYLRARYYNPATGTFNRLDPFAGNFSDPQSLHKYLYCHADAVNGIDPSGMMQFSIGGLLTGIAVGGLIGGSIGWAIGGKDGMIYGALLGAGIGAGVAMGGLPLIGKVIFYGWDAAKVVYGVLATVLTWNMIRSGHNNWGFSKTNAPKNVAVVFGDLGWKVNTQMFIENVSVFGFAEDAASADHNVSLHPNPNEEQLAQIMNLNDVVVILAHGPGNSFAIMGDFYDEEDVPMSGVRLGGKNLHENEEQVHQSFTDSPITVVPNKAWVTANELQGQVSNDDLILAVAGCRVGKTNRFSEAVGIDPAQGGHFASYNGDLNPAGIKYILYYARDYLNSGATTAEKNFQDLKDSRYVLDPTNTDFYSN